VNATHHGRLNTYVFQVDDQKIALLAAPPETAKTTSINTNFLLEQRSDFVEELKSEDVGLALVIKNLEVDKSELKEIPTEVQVILNDFPFLSLDDSVVSLPPVREIGHRIDLDRRTVEL